MSLGQNKLVKEFLIKIGMDGKTDGFIDIVSRGKIKLHGFVTMINDVDFFMPFSSPPKLKKEHEKKLPLILHFKVKKYISEKENVWKNYPARSPETPRQYLKNFKKEWNERAELYKIQIEDIERINLFGSIGSPSNINFPRYDIRVGLLGSRKEDIKILEAKNVPGLKDVVKK